MIRGTKFQKQDCDKSCSLSTEILPYLQILGTDLHFERISASHTHTRRL